MKNTDNIYLIGPMGSGKTAVGRQLAKELGREFFDSDAEIENATGVDIAYIFEKEGEASFRTRERECIAGLTKLEGIVLATGGGAVLDEENRRKLAANGTVIFLRTSVDRQLERTQHAKNRPLLFGANPRETLEELAAERGPIYEKLATFSVETGGRHVKAVVSNIRRILKKGGSQPLKN
ncbi:MAG: shikimate kinase AroK [Gammaproteobacteria bacterium]